jgi:phenylalanyl-tRNA synthetase beta chain
MNECVSYSFIDEKSSKLFAFSDEPTVLINPISSEMTHMRPNLIPGLLQAAMRNQSRSYNDLKLFEVGEIFFGSMPGEQTTHASGVFIGNDVARNSHSLPRAVDVFDAKKVVELALSDMGVSVDSLSVLREDPATYYHPGRVGSFSLGPKNVLASFGELHPKILKHYDIKGPAVAFEIFVENIPFPKHRKLTRASIKISEYQPVERDFSFVVDVGCEVDLIKKAILSSSKELISEARIFDIFEGKDAEKQLGKDKKSVAFMVRLQPLKATFTDDVLETISANIISSVKKASGGSLRS